MTQPSRCRKCGAVAQEIETMENTYRWRKDGPPPGEGWLGPVYPHAELQIYERLKRETVFDCKFVCPNMHARNDGELTREAKQ